ncbi:AAA family ATPase [Planctobacterium marinum]|uniref:AAA family ATPase n=1 Tax=Planctobacterium marinum TaxID=1631968 RepID=UPI001E5D5661|nr:AAA family ATPase [Planctobacterium marinum]MCC2607333.1 AAA family ATPase [Planctobacterium marinum]
MEILINVNNVQHVHHQEVRFDLSRNGITCITGKNSVGKTTLIRAIRNLVINSTFQETAAPLIFTPDSSIKYSLSWHNEEIVFKYNRFLKGIDSKQRIPESIKQMINIELPLPHGERFDHFRKLADIDEELRAKIAVGDYETPTDLIEFLHSIYESYRFAQLKSVEIKKTIYYFILKDEQERFYIREDYFSSGEYFLVNLYKQISKNKKLIVIDEIDISLDARAQTKLVERLRSLCLEFSTNIVFTTHSLALMKTLNDDELYYMEKIPNEEKTTIHLRPYNFIKSVMYGFKGYDKYILTEDKQLKHYIEYLISSSGQPTFYEYQIIYAGGGEQVVDLMERNARFNFFAASENVVTLLDGDKADKSFIEGLENILLLPFPSIEKQILQDYELENSSIPRVDSVDGGSERTRARNLVWKLTKTHQREPIPLMSYETIYKYLEKAKPEEVANLRRDIVTFLTFN